MKSRRFTVIVTVCAVFLILAGTAKSDRARRQGFSRPMMMTKIFEKAGCPLDESQIEQIKNLEPGPEKREAFLTILNADQKEAFKNTRLKKGDRAPRHMMMTKIFEKAGCPLTEAQIEQIKNIEPGPEKHDAFLAILNADQKEALKDTRLKKGDRAPRHMMMTKIFEKAGCPLTEAQIEQIKNLEPGPEKHDAFLAILNADQKEALKDSRLKKGGRAPRHAMMTRILKKAGCPLDEAQIEQIKNLEPGPEKHEAFLTILNADQKEAFKNTRLKKGDRAPRHMMMTRILEKAGCPLTEAQIEQIKNLEPGPEKRSEIESILTPAQKTALESLRGDIQSEQTEKPTAVEEQPEPFPVLKQNYPNPFNPATTIEYQLVKPGNVSIEIYGPSGQLVSTLVNEYQSGGLHSVVWDASTHAAGVYLCRITSGDFTQTQKMTLLK